MRLILTERVAKLGQMGDVVDVRPGYARNFLLPKRKAMLASDSNVAAFEARRSQLEARNLETRKEAEELASRLEGKKFVVIRQASEAGSLYGSVTPRDAAAAATEEGFSLDRKQIALLRPIKEIGLHDVVVTLHPEIDATICINVARSAEEAELQAAGLSLTREDEDDSGVPDWQKREEDEGSGEDGEAEGDGEAQAAGEGDANGESARERDASASADADSAQENVEPEADISEDAASAADAAADTRAEDERQGDAAEKAAS